MAGETILVVEDEAIIALNLRRILIGFGYQVPDPVESGQAAIQAAESNALDLVLMDIQLKGAMDGIEAARQINQRSSIPVVYLTAYSEDARLAQASQTAPYGYLIKPVSERELRATIEMALFKHQQDLRLLESEAAYRELYHNTPTMLLTVDRCGKITQISDYCTAVLGYLREELIDHDPASFITAESYQTIQDAILPVFYEKGAVQDAECQVICKNSQIIDVYFSMIGNLDEQGDLIDILVALVDVTARKRSEAAERDQRALAEALRDTTAALCSTLRLDEVLERILLSVGRVVPFDAVDIMLVENGAAHIERSLGFGGLGGDTWDLGRTIRVTDRPNLCQMAETLRPVNFSDTARVNQWQPDLIRSYAGAPIVARGRLLGFINLYGLKPGFFNSEHAARLQAFADQAAIAIENAHLYAEVQRLATLDELTGIANRRRLFELGRHEFDQARRYGVPLAAILLDIDRFKKINDTYGHTTGDRVLAGIARLISENIRDVDLFGRYGGEEFVLLLPMTERDAALDLAGRLLALVAGMRFETDKGPFSVTISIGVALLTDGTSSLATLIDWADQAMYAAKQAGRNRVEIYN